MKKLAAKIRYKRQFSNSRPEVFCKMVFFVISQNSQCQSLFFNRLATLLKKRFRHRCFLVIFMKFQWTPFYIEHLWWLPVIVVGKYNFLNIRCGAWRFARVKWGATPYALRKFLCLSPKVRRNLIIITKKTFYVSRVLNNLRLAATLKLTKC